MMTMTIAAKTRKEVRLTSAPSAMIEILTKAMALFGKFHGNHDKAAADFDARNKEVDWRLR